MYMVNQRLTTAVREGYRGAAGGVLDEQLEEARRALAWLAALHIDPDVRASLVEPVAVVEEALAEIARMSAPGTPSSSDA